MTYLGACGLIALGALLGILICLWERSLRRRLKRACKPTRGRALQRWLCREACDRDQRTDISYLKHNKHVKNDEHVSTR